MLLRSTLPQAMMPAIMSEQPALSERTTHEQERTMSGQPEHLTYTEAAKRLGITPNAVRMRAARGKLASVRLDERILIVWPQPGHLNDLHIAHEPSAQESAHDRTERAGEQTERLIVRLESEVAYLRSTLDDEREARSQAEARAAQANDNLAQVSDQLVRLTRGLEERMRELPATVYDVPQEHAAAPVRDDRPVRTSEPLKPASDTLALTWRRWWRRIRGDG